MNGRTSRRALLFGKTYLWLLTGGRWTLRRVAYDWETP